MPYDMLLDLRGIVSPLSLFKYKRLLETMEKGETAEVLIADRDVAKDLGMILQRSSDQLIYKKETADFICLGVKKG